MVIQLGVQNGRSVELLARLTDDFWWPHQLAPSSGRRSALMLEAVSVIVRSLLLHCQHRG